MQKKTLKLKTLKLTNKKKKTSYKSGWAEVGDGMLACVQGACIEVMGMLACVQGACIEVMLWMLGQAAWLKKKEEACM